MKKLLLGTTAIVGASFMATAAMAKPEVRVGGQYAFEVGMASQDVEGFGPAPGGVAAVSPERGYASISDAEVHVRASDKLDNGLSWTVKIELNANSDEGIDDSNADETSLTLSGAWGQMMFGNDDGPADTMRTGGKKATSGVGAGGVAGHWRRWVNWTTASTRVYSGAGEIRDTSDASKIAYITPRFAGFQAGASFSPDRAEEGRARTADNVNNAEVNAWELGVNYDQKFGEVRLGLAATTYLADNTNTLREDTKAYHVGALVGFGGFKVGTSYNTQDKVNLARTATNGKTAGWDVSVGYNMGAWDFGVGYFRSEAGNINSTGEHVLQVATVGATYEIGSGLDTYVEGVWFDVDSATNAGASVDNEGMALITGIKVRF